MLLRYSICCRLIHSVVVFLFVLVVFNIHGEDIIEVNEETDPDLAISANSPSESDGENVGEDDEIIFLTCCYPITAASECYTDNDILAGTRIRTDLKDIGSPVYVFTPEYLADTASIDNETLLPYSANAEVGGLLGNYSGMGSSFTDVNREISGVNPFLDPTIRIRGLDSVLQLRDQTVTDLPWDVFNIDRVDVHRGPESILCVFGGTGGTISYQLKDADSSEDFGSIENRIDELGSLRNSMDINRVLIDDILAIRISALDASRRILKNTEFEKDRRLFSAIDFRPGLFKNFEGTTKLSANFEHGKIKSDQSLLSLPADSFFNYATSEFNFRKWRSWDACNISLEQTFWQHLLGVTFVYDRQKFGNSQNIQFPDSINSDEDFPDKNCLFSDRQQYSATIFTQYDFGGNYVSLSSFGNLLGRHLFTAQYVRQDYDKRKKGFTTADYGSEFYIFDKGRKLLQKRETAGLNWQGHFLDESLVATLDWRQDHIVLHSGEIAVNNDGILNYPHLKLDSSSGDSYHDGVFYDVATDYVSWDVTFHLPQAVFHKLPRFSRMGFSINHGKCMVPNERIGFDARELPFERSESDDYSVFLSFFDDRLFFKATWFDTRVTNDDLSSTSSRFSILGENTYYLTHLEAWGTASALLDKAGWEGAAPGYEWYWNWALFDHPWPWASFPPEDYYSNHPVTQAQIETIDSWLDQLLPQEWYDAFGYPIDVALARHGNWENAVGEWDTLLYLSCAIGESDGRISGLWPTGSANTRAKGIELNVVGNISENLRFAINLSKTSTTRVSLGSELVAFIESRMKKYQSPAGDLRLWWAGDQTLREYFEENIWTVYLFLVEENGRQVSESVPWKASILMNYSFHEGRLDGFTCGLGYRWYGKRLRGYASDPNGNYPDLEKAWWSQQNDHIDLLLGYQFDINECVEWKIQLHCRNLGENEHIQLVSVKPDGSPAGWRRVEGQVWTLTNTISF